MGKFIRQVFPELANRRLSDLTPAQRDDANEDWIRANHAFARDAVSVEFLLTRIDALRKMTTGSYAMWQFVANCAALHDVMASKCLETSGGTDYSWFDNPGTVKEARELLKRLDLLPPPRS